MAWCNGRDDDLRFTLARNLGEVCTVFPTCGGRAGDGFTGVLAALDDETCSLISLDSLCRRSCGGGRNGREMAGRVQTFPLNRIGCVSTNRF